MAGNISGGPSRRFVLPGQAETDAAEAALAARVPQPTRRPLPPPAPLPEGFGPSVDDVPYTPPALGGPQPLPADPPTDDTPEPVYFSGSVNFTEISVGVRLTCNRRDYIGEGASLTEAVSIAAGALEEGLQQPVCPHCGQLMPEGEQE